MLKFEFECLYCGTKWTDYIYNESSLKNMNCNKCKDTNLKVKKFDKENVNVFGYSDDGLAPRKKDGYFDKD